MKKLENGESDQEICVQVRILYLRIITKVDNNVRTYKNLNTFQGTFDILPQICLEYVKIISINANIFLSMLREVNIQKRYNVPVKIFS